MFKNILQDNGTLMDIQEVELGDETEGDGLTADSRPDKSQENPPNTVIKYLKKIWGVME